MKGKSIDEKTWVRWKERIRLQGSDFSHTVMTIPVRSTSFFTLSPPTSHPRLCHKNQHVQLMIEPDEHVSTSLGTKVMTILNSCKKTKKLLGETDSPPCTSSPSISLTCQIRTSGPLPVSLLVGSNLELRKQSTKSFIGKIGHNWALESLLMAMLQHVMKYRQPLSGKGAKSYNHLSFQDLRCRVIQTKEDMLF